MKRNHAFSRMANAAAHFTGRPLCFLLAIGVVVAWVISGPMFRFSDTWQLVINTGTTIITFLMVFLIQNTQNRDTEAMQIKLDELIRATQGANNQLLDLEELEEHEILGFRRSYESLAQEARDCAPGDERRVGTPTVDQDPQAPQS
jgi:low affinity Fe/Cu permease